MEATPASGWLDTGNQLLGQQASQLQMALQIADQVMQQRHAEHQSQMDEFHRGQQERMTKVAETNSATNEAYRKSSEERQKKKEEQDNIEQALGKGFELYNKGVPFPTAFARAKKLDPDTISGIEQDIHETYKAKMRGAQGNSPEPERQEIPSLNPGVPPQGFSPGPSIAPQGQAGMAGVPQGPPVVPPQAAQMLPQIGMAGMPGMGAFAGAMPPMPQGPQGAPPQAPAPADMPQLPPQQLPPMMMQPGRAPFVDPSMQEALSQPSPMWQMKQEEEQAKRSFMKAREDVMQRQIALKEDMDPLNFEEKVAHNIATEESTRIKNETDSRMVDAKIKDFKDKLIRMDAKFVEQKKIDQSLISYRTSMAAAANTNAAHRATAVKAQDHAKSEWMRMAGLARQEENSAVHVENMLTQAEKAYAIAATEARAAESAHIINPDNAGMLKMFQATQADFIVKRDQYARLKETAHKTRTNANTLSNISAGMQQELEQKGILPKNGDGVTVPRMPNKPKNAADAAIQQLLGP